MSITAAAVAAAVRAELARAGVSQRKLADQLGWTPDYLRRRASGRIAFRVDELAEIADALDVPMASLISAAA